MRPRRALAAALLLISAMTAALAGCGGASHVSAAAYQKAALAACQSEVAFNRSLPALQRSQHLTIAELRQRANQRAARYLATLRALRPPAELQAAHRRLLADSANRPEVTVTRANLGSLIARERLIANDLATLGLRPCAAAARTAIAQLQGTGAALRRR